MAFQLKGRLYAVQGKYTVTPGANPGTHLWLLCNPGLPRRTPFVVDLGGSELMFTVRFQALLGLASSS